MLVGEGKLGESISNVFALTNIGSSESKFEHTKILLEEKIKSLTLTTNDHKRFSHYFTNDVQCVQFGADFLRWTDQTTFSISYLVHAFDV